MYAMFFQASSFNSDVSKWDVSSVTNMQQMFSGASSFNSNISSWDISSVTTMQSMFSQASSFNSNLSNWDVSSVTNMNGIFYQASSFNQNLCPWGPKLPVTFMYGSHNNAGYMFLNSGCPNTNSPTGPTGPWCAVTNCNA
jgi:surface protein